MSSRKRGRSSTSSQRAISRNGWTLVELLVVISLAVMMMGIVAAFLRIVFQSSAAAQRDANLQISVARLSDVFRADVRSAGQASTHNGSLQLKTHSGEIIHYYKTDRGVRRDETRANGQSQRDRFWLPGTWEVRWEVPKSSERPLIGIIIEPSNARPNLESSAFGRLTIRAALAGGRLRSDSSVP